MVLSFFIIMLLAMYSTSFVFDIVFNDSLKILNSHHERNHQQKQVENGV